MATTEEPGTEHREPEYDVAELILNRWSRQAMSGDPLTEEDIRPFLDAARYAWSSFNNQPWRFSYSLRNDEYWETYTNLIVDENLPWAADAGALFVVSSDTVFRRGPREGQPSRTHVHDTGAATYAFALEACRRGYAVRAMEGFDYEGAADALNAPEDHEIQVMIAVGHPGDPEDLPEYRQDREYPSERAPVEQFTHRGTF